MNPRFDTSFDSARSSKVHWRRVGAIAACAAVVAVASASARFGSSDPGIAELGPGAWQAATAAASDAQLAVNADQRDAAVEGARSRPAAVPLITPVPRRGRGSIAAPKRVPPRRRDMAALSTSGGWHGDYFNNTSLSGAPALSRKDGEDLSFAWGGSPGPGVNADGFSVRWTATLNFDGGLYDITSTHDDGVRMYVDGGVVLNTWWDAPPTAYQSSASIAAGSHTLVVEYYHKDGAAIAQVRLARAAAPSPTATQPAATSTPTPTPTAAPTNTAVPTAVSPVSTTSTPTPTIVPSTATSTPAARVSTPTAAPTLPPTVAPPPATATSTALPPTATPAPPTATSTRVPPSATPAASTLNSVDRIIATRGDNLLHHEINLPSMISFWSWGQHGTEDNPSLPPGAGSINAWLVVERDNSQLNTNLNVRVNVRNIRAYAYRASTHSWTLVYSGLPTWMVRTADPGTAGPYYDVAPQVEADGSYSFDMPVGAALHMASPAPGLRVSESNGVLTTVEARVIGPDAGIARLGMEAGADYRDSGGGNIQQSGAGQFGLLTTYWRAFDMLSSTLTDAEVRLNPPPVQ